MSYTYNLDGTTASKTDAKGIKVEFSYDAYKRVTVMRKSTQIAGTWTEDRCQRTSYFYDENGGSSYGRLTRTRWNWKDNGQGVEVPCDINPLVPGPVMAFTELYSYNSAGRITQKTLTFTRGENGVVGGGESDGELDL